MKDVLTKGGTQNAQFPSYHDVKLPKHLIGPKISDKRQFRFAMKDLKAWLKKNPARWKAFTPSQQKVLKAAFSSGKVRPTSGKREGFTWHHHEDSRFLQLVDRPLHSFIGHFGGRFTSGGRP